jgi:hypothetical protein
MQVFVPSTDLSYVAKSLDLKRLGKQIIECRQIGLAITNPDYGWQHHPAVNMWRGHLKGLMIYATFMDTEWKIRRGKQHGAYINMCGDHDIDIQFLDLMTYEDYMPDWWGRDDIHDSHASRLIQKDPDHYTDKFYWIEDKEMEYVWVR